MANNDAQEKPKPKLSEDWLAVIIGLLVVVLVWVGGITSVPWPLFGWFK